MHICNYTNKGHECPFVCTLAKTRFCPIFSFFSSVGYKMKAYSYLIKIYLSDSKYPSTFLLTIFIYICVLGVFTF